MFPGFFLCSEDEDGVQRLYVDSVKDTGLASKKGEAQCVCLSVCLKLPFRFPWWWVGRSSPGIL